MIPTPLTSVAMFLIWLMVGADDILQDDVHEIVARAPSSSNKMAVELHPAHYRGDQQ